jgi:hypothetical protein
MAHRHTGTTALTRLLSKTDDTPRQANVPLVLARRFRVSLPTERIIWGFSHEPRLLTFSCVASLIIIKGFTPMEWSSDVTFHHFLWELPANCNQEMES